MRGMMGRAHGKLVFGRRAARLIAALVSLIPRGARVLDIGCGNGFIAHGVMSLRPDITVTGLDVRVRPDCMISCAGFDGTHIPHDDRAFDLAMFIDVLHHADEPYDILTEAVRVSGGRIVIKDHLANGPFDRMVLRFMDWFGNAPHGVRLPYNFMSRKQWDGMFNGLGLNIQKWEDSLGLYPFPANLLFERGLHFMTLVEQVER